MQMRAGFTLVELLITVLVAVILLTLGTVSVTGFQTQARDKERDSDIKSIARQLETVYSSGLTMSEGQIKGEYPTIQMVQNYSNDVWAGMPKAALIAPGDTASSLKFAGNNLSPGVSPTPSATNQYIYQPINRNNGRCTESPIIAPPTIPCVRFNLYYWSEATNSTVMIKSRHQ